MTQLSFGDTKPGYYHVRAESTNRNAGCGWVAWYETAEAAREAVVHYFTRSHRATPGAVHIDLVREGAHAGTWHEAKAVAA